MFTAHFTRFVPITRSNRWDFHLTVIKCPCSPSCWWTSSNEARCSALLQTELGANPLANSGIELGAFNGLSSLYIGIAEAKLTAVPKGQRSTWSALTSSPLSSLSGQDALKSARSWKQPKRVIISGVLFLPDLPSSITELSLDYNKISKVEVEDFKRYKNLQRWRPSPVYPAND